MRRRETTHFVLAATAIAVAALGPGFSSRALAAGDGCAVERPLHPGAPGPNRIALDEDLLTQAKPVRYAEDAADAQPIGGLGGVIGILPVAQALLLAPVLVPVSYTHLTLPTSDLV